MVDLTEFDGKYIIKGKGIPTDLTVHLYFIFHSVKGKKVVHISLVNNDSAVSLMGEMWAL